MAKWRGLAALLLVGLIALAPGFAEARAGGSYGGGGGGSFSSQGSLGSRTYNAPMQRSLTPQSAPPLGQAPGYSPGYGNYHPFLTGLAGGLFGGWLGSMLFPHWGMGMGYGGMGFGGVIGPVFIWLLIIWLGWMGFRLFSRRFSPLTAPGGGAMGFGGLGGSGLGAMGGYAGAAAPAASSAPLAISGADYQAFETILKAVQTAWSNGDLAELRRHVTPEMLSYFAEELAENQSRGVVNRVDQVELLRGDLREAWDEGRLQYATCLLHWRALDYTVRADRHPGDPDFVASGDPRQPTEAAEAWTFARSPGGHWLLSAIQQV
jgi:predicted lipid-binding transport protein (Tim44 family)